MTLSRDGRHFIRKRYRDDEQEGVASVIGTIFALMIFLTLITLVVTTFVPAWEKSNEQDFLNTSIFQMSQVKGYNFDLADSLNPLGNSRYVPFTMTPDEVPLFGKSYLGNLTYTASGAGTSSMSVSFTNSSIPVTITATGSLTFTLENSYYDQIITYEHGAVILTSIEDDERNPVFKSDPPISYTTNPNGSIDVTIIQFDFVGTSTSMPSSGTVEVVISLTEEPTIQTYDLAGDDLVITWTTDEYAAWESWANETFSTVGTVSETDGTVTLTLTNVYELDYTMVKTEMELA